MNWHSDEILVTGGTGLVGTALVRRLREHGCNVFACGFTRGTARYNLMDTAEVRRLFDKAEPDIVIDLAAKVGGIYANMVGKAEFYMTNTLMNTNIMREVQERKVPYVMAMGTGCAYPKRLEGSVMREEEFLDGIPEETNNAYAYSKRNLLVNLQACEEEYGLDYSYCILPNIFGENDNYHPLNSHVVPALVRKFVEAVESNAPSVPLWGKGTAGRDFVYVEDVVDAFMIILETKWKGAINIASGKSTTIREVADSLKKITRFDGDITYDSSYPDGQAMRIFDVDKITEMGWAPSHTIEEGLIKTVEWFKSHGKDLR